MLTSRPLKAICSSKYMAVDKGVLSKAITGVIFVADICRAKVLPVFSFLVGRMVFAQRLVWGMPGLELVALGAHGLAEDVNAVGLVGR